jgi:hypothetical protein
VGRDRNPNSKTAKELFLEHFGHQREDHHVRGLTIEEQAAEGGSDPEGITAGPVSREKLELWKRFPWRQITDSVRYEECHWWSCRNEPTIPETKWSELLAALKILQDNVHDLHGPDAQAIIGIYDASRDWGSHRESLEWVAGLLSQRGPAGYGEEMRKRFVADVDRLLPFARAARPDPDRKEPRGRHENHPLRFALEEAAERGWKSEDVAALLFLTRIDDEYDSIWKSVLDRVRKADQRRKTRK